MSDETIRGGLEDDRYLKALKLVDQFDTSVLDALEGAGREMLSRNGFDLDTSFDRECFGEEYSATLATIRAECKLHRDGDPDRPPKLNLALEWVDSGDGEVGSEAPLCYVQYKIQHGSQDAYRHVREATEADDSWSEIEFGEDQWYHASKHAPGTIYIPVDNEAELDPHLGVLIDHFSNVYAPALRV